MDAGFLRHIDEPNPDQALISNKRLQLEIYFALLLLNMVLSTIYYMLIVRVRTCT